MWGSLNHTGNFSRKIRIIRENKMVLMNLFAGQECRHRCRVDLWTQRGMGGWDELSEPHGHVRRTTCNMCIWWEAAV